MKFLPSQIIYFLRNRTTQRNLVLLAKFFLFLAFIISIYSVLFHLIMLVEGKEYSWITGFYWTLTVMSTLGFGDITFSTDLGLLFTIMVLLSGVVFLLIMLPFTLIQFFYAPWLESQAKTRTPRELPEGTSGHIILTNLDPIAKNLIRKIGKFNYEYVIIAPDMQRALELYDLGYKTVLGDIDDPETYRRLRVEDARLVVATNDDQMNTNISFTIREITDKVPIVSIADNVHSMDILEFPGNTHVFHFVKMLGRSLGQRALGVEMGMHEIGRFGQLIVWEASAAGTPLEGNTLAKSQLRQLTGLTVAGFWETGKLKMPDPQTKITSSTILVLAGTLGQMEEYSKHFGVTCVDYKQDAPILILGGGRVGCAVAELLEEHRVVYNIVEKNEKIRTGNRNYIIGDAADLNTLKEADIENARAVIVTTHDDAMNIYLTFYCRQLRPDIQIVSRANRSRTISKLYTAGADMVMSYSIMGANAIISLLQPNEISLFMEGLNVFSRPVHSSFIGRSIAEIQIREQTGVTLLAINRRGEQLVNPDPFLPLEKEDELILIGTVDAENRFIKDF